MTRQDAAKIGEFLTFLVFFRAVPLFSWSIEEDETFPDGFYIRLHAHDTLYFLEVIRLVSGISGLTFFNWHLSYSNYYPFDILLY